MKRSIEDTLERAKAALALKVEPPPPPEEPSYEEIGAILDDVKREAKSQLKRFWPDQVR